jgi:uncharacterized membrane protein (DUF4010 family)
VSGVSFDLHALWSVAVALLGGLAIGIERQWSGHAAGPRARFAGVRTFSLLGLISGTAGWLWTAGIEGPATVVVACLGATIVVAYLSASRHDIDGTTEVAALVVVVAGVLAGAGFRPAASGMIAVTALLLVEKRRLHGWVGALDREELRAGARFAVMATVILPLLPTGPFGPYGVVRPRLLWALVLFFSGFSFIGYVARRLVGASRGLVLTGTLGGVLSSTSVALTSAELSRRHPEAGRALAAGTLGACALLLPRVLITAGILAPALPRELWPAFVAPTIIGALAALREWRADGQLKQREQANPLQFTAALYMAALFQVVLFGIAIVSNTFGERGLYASAAVLGLADMDALTVSMAQLTAGGTAAEVTAKAVTIGVIANTFVKLGITMVVGRGAFRILTALGLVAMAAALAGALVWLL